MADDVRRSGVSKGFVAFMLLCLLPALGALGWVARQLLKAPEPCPLCAAVESGDPAQVRAAVEAGGAVTTAAWHDALERLHGSAGPTAALVEIATLLLDHGGDPNDFWTPSGTYSVTVPGFTSGARFGSTTLSAGPGSPTSRRRVFAAQVVAETSDDVGLIDRLLANGLDVQGRSAGEALVAAARLGHIATTRRLLDAGVPANYVTNEAPRRTALAEAIQSLDLPLIAVLEAKGAREW